MTFQDFNTPVGLIRVVVNENDEVIQVDLSPGEEKKLSSWTPTLQKIKTQLEEYFLGSRSTFELPFSLKGTEFEIQAWRVLQRIPAGNTWTYQEQALALGRPKAVRAVGSANRKNPIPLFIPCHRVIGKNGKLVGYAGGLPLKEKLLRHEQRFRTTWSLDSHHAE